MGSSDSSAASGSGVLRHAPREEHWEPAAEPDTEAAEAIEQHITQHFGPIEFVWHEVASDLIHLDVHVVNPTPERPYFTLVTSGMSDLPMTVPAEAEVGPYAELMICLPADWPMTGEEFRQDSNYWPVGLLKSTARLPHNYKTWIGMWHSVPNGDPAEPYAEDTPFAGVLIAPMLRCAPEARTITTPSGKEISLLALVPLHSGEIKTKVNEGTDALLDALASVEVSELFNPARPSSV